MTGNGRAPAASPWRWLLVLTIVVVAAFTAWRILAAIDLDLRSDEAYYWTWTQQWPLSFLDQPPMVAWFERLGQLVFGNTTLGARFAQLVALPLSELLLADIARRRTGSWNAALFVVLAIECAVNYAFFAIVVEPSAALLLFTSLVLWSLVRLDETENPRWWLLIGAAGGLALLSKYIVLLVAPALLVFLLIDRRHRRWMTTPWPYLAIAIAAVLFSPVLIWNARHGWVSFLFQSARLGEGQHLGVGNLFRFGLYETIEVGIVLLPAAIIGAVVLLPRALRTRDGVGAAIAVAFLFPLGFLLIRSLTLQINQSWAWFLWPLGVLCLALALPWHSAPRRVALLIGAIAVTGLPLVGALLYHATFDRSVLFGRGDPLGQDAGFGDFSQDVLAAARKSGATWIATSEYRTYADLLWHIGAEIPVVQINQRSRFLDFAPQDPALFQGRALYVHSGPITPLISGALGPSRSIVVSYRETPMEKFTVETLDGFTPDLNPPPGSPAYAADPSPTASGPWAAKAR